MRLRNNKNHITIAHIKKNNNLYSNIDHLKQPKSNNKLKIIMGIKNIFRKIDPKEYSNEREQNNKNNNMNNISTIKIEMRVWGTILINLRTKNNLI
jgi:hypothetical protein